MTKTKFAVGDEIIVTNITTGFESWFIEDHKMNIGYIAKILDQKTGSIYILDGYGNRVGIFDDQVELNSKLTKALL